MAPALQHIMHKTAGYEVLLQQKEIEIFPDPYVLIHVNPSDPVTRSWLLLPSLYHLWHSASLKRTLFWMLGLAYGKGCMKKSFLKMKPASQSEEVNHVSATAGHSFGGNAPSRDRIQPGSRGGGG
ncbi:MAG: hypothetical protein A2X56_08625 [Nitrospirae bacterium GWC2_57_13]|nr:MAG: hypothetical protein A2X56_08625 [Nitrospirae bacterium GWC2_57_13]